MKRKSKKQIPTHNTIRFESEVYEKVILLAHKTERTVLKTASKLMKFALENYKEVSA